jgi:hypothetical protein
MNEGVGSALIRGRTFSAERGLCRFTVEMAEDWEIANDEAA